MIFPITAPSWASCAGAGNHAVRFVSVEHFDQHQCRPRPERRFPRPVVRSVARRALGRCRGQRSNVRCAAGQSSRRRRPAPLAGAAAAVGRSGHIAAGPRSANWRRSTSGLSICSCRPSSSKHFASNASRNRCAKRYGQNVFGQSLLLARRLVESGVRTTVVYWPDRSEPEAFNNNGVVDKVAVAAWDTHGHHVGNTPNFPRLKDHNLPPLDRGLTAFLGDLSERGLLDETLVAVTGEFGRSPKINGDAGRDHYGNVFSALLAGGGIKGARPTALRTRSAPIRPTSR